MKQQLDNMVIKKIGPNKGIKFSEEHKRKLSETKKRQFREGSLPKFIGGVGNDNLQYGKHISEKQRMIQSDKMSGKKNPFYGKTHSKKTIVKIQSHPGYKNRHISMGDEHWTNKLSEEDKELFNKKFGKANRGRKNPSISELNKLKIGNKNPAWQGGISFEPYDSTFNNAFKRDIRKRDNQICMLCKIHREKLKRALNVHHINYDKKLSIPQNCVSLCDSCHAVTNHNRKHWQALFQSMLADQYKYSYNKQEIILTV